LPEFAVPELNSTTPDVPATTEFADQIDTVPLLDEPPPLLTVTAPPVALEVVWPALKNIAPPAPLAPVPTTMLMTPPEPAVEYPVNSAMYPELPDFDVPVLNDNAPDTPTLSTFAVEMVTLPVPLLADVPVLSWIAPPMPLAYVVRPADSTIDPPTPLDPAPTATLMAPPDPEVADPDSSAMYPLFPAFDVPVLSNTEPDTPADATFADEIVTEPDPALRLLPLEIVTAPPAAADSV